MECDAYFVGKIGELGVGEVVIFLQAFAIREIVEIAHYEYGKVIQLIVGFDPIKQHRCALHSRGSALMIEMCVVNQESLAVFVQHRCGCNARTFALILDKS